MAKAKLPRVNRTRKKLADGTVREFHYHRPTGTPLPGVPGSPEYVTAWLAAERAPMRNVGTLSELIDRYLASMEFSHRNGKPRSEKTKREYRRILRAVEDRLGTLPIKALESPKVNGTFIDYHEEIAMDRPREADNRITVLSIVLSYAKRRGDIVRNPLEGFKRVYHGDRSQIVWQEADIRRFMADAPLELQHAMILALHTTQRYGDLIRMQWSDYDGTRVRVVQSKTGAKLWIPATATLKAMLDSMPRRSPFILTRADGRPWHTAKNDKELGKAWRAHMAVAGFYPKPFAELTKEEKQGYLHFSDLRGTGITLLAMAGCELPQIASISGHTMKSAAEILKRYLAHNDAIAQAAILRFENAPETAFANRLQTAVGGNVVALPKAKGNQ